GDRGHLRSAGDAEALFSIAGARRGDPEDDPAERDGVADGEELLRGAVAVHGEHPAARELVDLDAELRDLDADVLRGEVGPLEDDVARLVRAERRPVGDRER